MLSDIDSVIDKAGCSLRNPQNKNDDKRNEKRKREESNVSICRNVLLISSLDVNSISF